MVRKPLTNAEGLLRIMVVIGRDATNSRRMAAVLQRAQDELELQIHRRTAELLAEVEERRTVEQALLESEQKFRDFVTASPNWFWEM